MTIEVLNRVGEIRAATDAARRSGLTVGLVPTMGALHEGHLALIRACRKECGLAVVSIFVNPVQFGPGEDFHHYPRDIGRDARLAAGAGADVIFAPAATEIYPPGFRTRVEVAGFSRVLCGRWRPGHFRGVATVVLKLFTVVTPDRAWFGWKDAQQLIIIRRMARDLALPVVITGLPTVREADGLALSSRNRYLSPADRARAPVLFRVLERVRTGVERRGLPLGSALCEARARLEAEPGLRLQYLSAVNPETLRPVSGRRPGQVLVLAAVFLGGTRLIDNVFLSVPGSRGKKKPAAGPEGGADHGR